MDHLYQVMLVDDEPGALEQWAEYIDRAEQGFHVVAKAQGGEEALFDLKLIKPDLVITDIRMPVMDGLQMLALMRSSGWNGQAAIISGHDDFSYAQQAIHLGVSEYLLKPVFPEDIRALLESTRARFDKSQDELAQLRQTIQAELQNTPPVPMTEVLPSYLLAAKNYIHQHYAEALTLTQVAKAVAINPAYLSARFAKHCGVNFLEYVTRYRMGKAKELLERTNLQIQEVACQVGYADLAYFSRLFRRETGQTPGSYRTTSRGKGSHTTCS